MRFARITLAGAVALTTALAACGGGDDSGGGGDGSGKTLNVLIAANTQYPDEFAAWQKTISEKFRAQTGAEVKFETFASANDELTKIQTSVVSGSGPDVYAVGTTFTPTAYSTGAFVKMGDEEWGKIGGKEKFNPATLGISGPDEQNQVGIPWVSRPFVMAYNTELLKAAGIAKPATTWDELAQHAKQLTKGDQYGLAVAYKDNFDPWKFVWGMSIQAGNPLVDGKTAKLQDPTVLKAYDTYFGWLTRDKVVDPAAVGWTNPQAVAAFAKGKTGYFMLTTPTAINSLEQGAVKGKWAFALLPTVPPGATSRPANGVEAASILSGDNLLVADYSKNKDLAFEYVKLVTDSDAQLDYYKKFGNLPANAAALQTLASDKQLAPVTEAAKKSVATPFTGAWGDIQLALTNVAVQSLPDLGKGSISAQQIEARVADAQKAAQSALDRAK
ncbi:extracellular solute-binding protein [Actinoplanes sp. URMC 104]|uniref:extracellular solute-binding protein n=1 Tax=Actinoplanes sp. URMC 104 TaxID=3423409 RepID=UPI003F1ABEC7